MDMMNKRMDARDIQSLKDINPENTIIINKEKAINKKQM